MLRRDIFVHSARSGNTSIPGQIICRGGQADSQNMCTKSQADNIQGMSASTIPTKTRTTLASVKYLLNASRAEAEAGEDDWVDRERLCTPHKQSHDFRQNFGPPKLH